MAQRRSIKGLGRELYFTETPRQKEEPTPQEQDNLRTTKQESPTTERATFYIRPEQNDELDMVKVRLRSKLRGQRRRQVDKSELVRLAIDLLCEQEDASLIECLVGESP